MGRKPRRFWLIEGYDSTTRIFQGYRPKGDYSENRMRDLLASLTAKAGLEYQEILDSYARRNSKRYALHLEVQRSGPPFMLMCGSNPCFVATIIDEGRLADLMRSGD